jgi:superfamily II DNA or RNA helicase
MSTYQPTKGKFVTDGRFLYCPKEQVNVRALRYGLAYGDQPSEGVVSEDHIRIPRHYKLGLDYELIDESPKIYPRWKSTTVPVTSPRDYQVEPLEEAKKARGGILNLGCGYGKTVLACYYMAYEGFKAAVLVDKVNLLSQWAEEITTHLDIPLSRVGVVQGQRWDWDDYDIVVCSIQTLARRGDDVPAGFYESFGVAVFDECHHMAAPTFKALCHRFTGIRLGLSATPKREDGMEDVFTNHIGPVFYSKVDQELVPRIIFQQTGTSAEVAEQRDALSRNGEIHYRKLCACLGREVERNIVAVSYAEQLLRKGHHILCLTASAEHVDVFADVLNKQLNIPVGIAKGDIKGDSRANNIKGHQISVGTLDVASEALNVPSLSALIILTPFGARQHGNVLQQTLGRIQRKYEGKPSPIAIFLEDENIGFCIGLSKQIKRVLRDIGYNYERRPFTDIVRGVPEL